jgi:stage II sporulation protein P
VIHLKAKSSIVILGKLIIICALVWYLPTKVVDSVKVIDAMTQEENTVTTPVSKNKKIHIYNTHQGEEYAGYNVMEGAKYLGDCLNAQGYTTNVDGNNIPQYMSANAMDYTQCYSVSKMYLEQALATNGPYDLIIDFHRDSISKELSTITYEGVSYAKVMFVAGESSGKYDSVNQASKDLSTRLNEKIPDISRGVYVKKSHYNQGTSDNMVLIEIGAKSNTKDEIMRTIELLSEVINAYLEG